MDGLLKRVRMTYRGRFHCKVDSKGRLNLPMALVRKANYENEVRSSVSLPQADFQKQDQSKAKQNLAESKTFFAANGTFSNGFEKVFYEDPPLKTQETQENKTFVLTNNFNGDNHFIDVLPVHEWSLLEKRIQTLPKLNKSVQTFQRFYMAAGQEITLDNNNRLLLPMGLRSYANICSEVVVVGMGDKFEIWSQQCWEKAYQQMQSGFEKSVEDIASLLGEI